MSKNVKEVTDAADGVLNRIKQALKNAGDAVKGNNANSAQNSSRGYTSLPSSDPLLNILRELETEYRAHIAGVKEIDPNTVIPPSLNLEPKVYDGKSDTELRAQAEAALSPAYEKNVNSLEEKTSATISEVDKKLSEYKLDEENDLAELNDEASDARREHRSDMIMQGLVNSTINVEGSKAIEDYVATAFKRISKEYDTKYTVLEEKVIATRTAYENALREYDLQFAADLQTSIGKLKTQQEARLKEINAYNAKIAAQESEYQEERARKIAALQQERLDAINAAAVAEAEQERLYGISAEKQAEYNERFDVAREYYSAFPSDVAQRMVLRERESLRTLLGGRNLVLLLSSFA